MIRINEHMIRNTPEVHDCEWEPELSPCHEWVKVFAIVGSLLIAIPALFYALSEMREPLGKIAVWVLNFLGLPSW